MTRGAKSVSTSIRLTSYQMQKPCRESRFITRKKLRLGGEINEE